MATIHWPAEEWAEASRLLAKGLTVREVAQKLQRNPKAVQGKIRYESMTPAEREERRERINAQRRSRASIPDEARYQPERLTGMMKIPERVLADRFKRQSIIRD